MHDPRSIIIVRDAFVKSVTCCVVPFATPAAPPVRFHATHESTVPTRAVPFSKAVLTAGTLSSSQRSLTPVKYVEIGRPHVERRASCPPSAASVLPPYQRCVHL